LKSEEQLIKEFYKKEKDRKKQKVKIRKLQQIKKKNLRLLNIYQKK